MKIIKYKYLSAEINHGTEETPDIEQILLTKELHCPSQAVFDENYHIAEEEAVGEITVEDDGTPEPAEELTPEQRIAELEEALALLLSGVTE